MSACSEAFRSDSINAPVCNEVIGSISSLSALTRAVCVRVCVRVVEIQAI